MQVDEEGLETYKIGVTKNNPELRVKQLQTGNPNKISVVNSYETPNYLKVEQWIHRKYFNSKTLARNEWRNLTNDEVMSFLIDCEKANETISVLKKTNHFFN